MGFMSKYYITRVTPQGKVYYEFTRQLPATMIDDTLRHSITEINTEVGVRLACEESFDKALDLLDQIGTDVKAHCIYYRAAEGKLIVEIRLWSEKLQTPLNFTGGNIVVMEVSLVDLHHKGKAAIKADFVKLVDGVEGVRQIYGKQGNKK